MLINAQYSAESSNLSEKLIFLCERYDLTREDIKELKSKKLLKFINEDDLPKAIPCQVIVHCETYRKAKLTFFNPRFNLPLEVYNEPFLNKDIIESSKRNG